MKSKNRGFSVIEGLLILVIIGLVGFVGWYVWQSKQIVDKQAAAAQKNITPSQQAKDTTITEVPVNPKDYIGWKDYCDDTNGVCVKHPADWINRGNTPAGDLPGDFVSPGKSLILVQGKVSTEGNSHCSTYCGYTIKSLSAFKVNDVSLVRVGAFMDSGGPFYVPQYFVVDAAIIQKYDLAVGKKTPADAFDNLIFTTKSGIRYSVNIFDGNQSEAIPRNDAVAWFNSADSQTAALIAKSIYFTK